ncbi:L,D-transpeptidase family protein [Collinsella tanakaei]|uniref:L,D-transpeptidase family protein n=1 Tax=Collinsella tanakaei TaxID=626935 RepID=UPI0025A49AC3|nr:L,D-transpeptidase family protein [Collinsella tanakaei]MDM8301408.1 L,D-transpeptidase family protein [Collinsella tanakaei]
MRPNSLEPVKPGQMPARRTNHVGAHAAPAKPAQATEKAATSDATRQPASTPAPAPTPRRYGQALERERLERAQAADATRERDEADAVAAKATLATAPDMDQTIIDARLNVADDRGGTDPHFAPLPDIHGAGPARAKEDKPSGSGRGAKIALGVVGGLLVAGYAAGVVAFSNLYYPGTSIAGIDVSLTDAATAAERIESSVGEYSLHVSGVGLDWTYTPEEGTFAVDGSAEAQAVLMDNEAFAWPIRLISNLMDSNKETEEPATGLVVTYDEEGFAKALTAEVDKINENRPGTFDAAGAYDEEAGKFTVEKARSSQKLDADAIVAAAQEAISHAETSVELDDSMYVEFAGGATDEELQKACDAANEIIGVDVDLTMGGKTVATLDGKTMTQWITFDDDLSPVLASDGLTGWIRELASSQLDTVGTERRYTRADGKEIEVSGGTYGWISDEAKLADLIQEAVAEKKTGEIEIPTKQSADVFNGAGGRDWGAYVDIDLTEQHVRYYSADDELLWESGCISGSPEDNNYTPTGVYMLNSNDGGATLVGKDEDGDGEPDYETPVNYWMPFVGGAVGLHDADWQAESSFSDPDAYTWTGSHGCVNLPPAKAKKLSEMIEVGTCVISHY